MAPEGTQTVRDGLAQRQVFFGGGNGNLARLTHHLAQNFQQKFILAADVVQQRRLVDARLSSQFARAGLGESPPPESPCGGRSQSYLPS
jgi:hypothetical protein